jgi:transposase
VKNYAGIDVSLELSSVCVVDAQGKILKEAKVASEPDALVEFFERLGFAVKRIGLEAGPLSQWLHAGLKGAGLEAVLLETRHVKAALSAMTVKTDRKDARGIAQLIRMGWFQPVHAKSVGAQEIRAHHGGPKSPVPPAMGQISSGSDIYAQEVDVARGVKAKKSRAYRGGPKAVVPHRC